MGAGVESRSNLLSVPSTHLSARGTERRGCWRLHAKDCVEDSVREVMFGLSFMASWMLVFQPEDMAHNL